MAIFGRWRQKEPAEPEKIIEEAPVLPEPPSKKESGLRSVADHCEYLLSAIEPLPAFGMTLLDASGLALCEDIRGDGNVPEHTCAQLDGYAIRAADILSGARQNPWLMLSGATAGELATGQAIEVSAGEALPEGTDTVLDPDYCEVSEGGVITMSGPLIAGAGVTPMGSHVTDGQVLIRTGQVLTARHASQLAVGGYDRVLARPRTRIAVLSFTQDEPSEPLPIDAVPVDANSCLLATAAKADGATVISSSVIATDADAVYEAVSDELIRSDLLLITGCLSDEGAASVELLRKLGPIEIVDVALEPGRRHGFGLVGADEIPVLLLPDDPIATFAAYQAFVRPVIRKLMGLKPYREQPILCFVEEDMVSNGTVLELVLGHVREQDANYMVSAIGNQHQHLLRSLVEANVLIGIPEGKTELRAGDAVMCWFLEHV